MILFDDLSIYFLGKNTVSLSMSLQYKPPPWANSTNIYEVNLRQYTAEGTFNSFANHLPRLMGMGVETLWFMPLTPIAQKNKKGTLGSYYACSDYCTINPEFGTMDDFKNLVNEAHEMGFKVIVDWVANHTGWDHEWTKKHPEWYKRESDGNFKKASGMDDIIELDFTNHDLRNAMIAAMEFWVSEFDIDGFRCDLAFWVDIDFWKQARTHLDTIKKLFWLGEFDPLDTPAYTAVFDASYTWTWMHRTEEFYRKQLPFDVLPPVLYRYDGIRSGSMYTWFTSNHDENSWNGTEFEKYGDMAMLLAVFSCTWKGLPLIYSGQELPNKKRLKFFDKDEIMWSDKIELHDFYRPLLNLHSLHPALSSGDRASETYVLSTNDEKNVFVYLRKSGDREVLVLLNFSGDNRTVEIKDEITSGDFRNVFSNEIANLSTDIKFIMQPWGFAVYEK